MIQRVQDVGGTPTRADLQRVLDADLRANEMDTWTWRNNVSAVAKNRIMRWQRSLRWIEYLSAQPTSPRRRIALSVLWRLHMIESVKLGFVIPPNVFGPGLQIAHYGTITVNTRARVGCDCRIHPSTTIGVTHDGSPVIGDRCYLGPGVRVLGDVRLGNEVVVVANAVVTKTFEQDNIILGGSPARILRADVPFRRLH